MDPKRKKALLALGGIATAVIGVLAVGIPLALSMNSTTSAPGTLDIDRAPVAPVAGPETSTVIGELTRPVVNRSTDPNVFMNFWTIPVDAPLSTMPPGSMCDAAQTAWLRANAEPYRFVEDTVSVRVRNSADRGASMSIGNMRLDGTLTDVAASVYFQCGGIGDGGYQPINLYFDGSPGTWAKSYGAPNPMPEGSIATINLAPGELADIAFIIPPTQKHFQGRIVADLVGSDTELLILADELEYPAAPVFGYSVMYPEGEFLVCRRPDTAPVQCTYAEAEELLREAARASG